MIILDTNVLSAVMQRVADPVIVVWLDRQPPQSLWLTAITVFEVAFGLHLLAPASANPAAPSRSAMSRSPALLPPVGRVWQRATPGISRQPGSN